MSANNVAFIHLKAGITAAQTSIRTLAFTMKGIVPPLQMDRTARDKTVYLLSMADEMLGMLKNELKKVNSIDFGRYKQYFEQIGPQAVELEKRFRLHLVNDHSRGRVLDPLCVILDNVNMACRPGSFSPKLHSICAKLYTERACINVLFLDEINRNWPTQQAENGC